MKYSFVDLSLQHAPMRSALVETFALLLDRSSFISGAEVESFEESFAAYIGTSHCVALSSGTAALHLALLALGVGPGDEVITVSHTFVATVEAITAVGAQPVLVDVDPVSYTLDPDALRRAISPKTRAVIPVHLYGQPADMYPILDIAEQYNLAVIEDACQAHGATYLGRKAGSLGNCGCFSFFPSKNLGCCGEGGAFVTDDEALARQVRMLRAHGGIRKYEHEFPGFNLRMEELQGAILRLKLQYLESWNDSRRKIARLYNERLAAVKVVTPIEMLYARHVYHLYVIQTENRDVLRKFLADSGIEAGLHYPQPVHRQMAYKSLGYSGAELPVTERLASRILSLPMYPGMKPEAVDYIASQIDRFWAAGPQRVESAGASGPAHSVIAQPPAL